MSKPWKIASWIAVAGIAWSIGYIYNARYGGELSWLRMMYEQKMALADQVKGPVRVLTTGGSGAHYTVDAQLMQKELGIPVVNLGLDGPPGLDVVLASMSEKIRRGDIVVLIPEYLILLDETGFGERAVPFSVAIGRPEFVKNMPPKRIAQDLLMLGSPTLRALTKSTVDVVEKGKMTGYYSDPVSDRGDPTVLKKRGDVKWWQLKINNSVSKHAIERIAQFRKEVEAKGATLVLALPWVYGSTDDKTVGNVKKTAAELAKIAPLIYDKQSYDIKTDSSMFADTHYHLNPEGRRLRTLELVEQLRPIIESKTKTPDATSKQPQ